MKSIYSTSLCLIVILLLLSTGCAKQDPAVDDATLKFFAPVPAQVAPKSAAADVEKVALGRMLYFEPRLSRDQQVSCNSCHPLDKFGADGAETSTGFRKQHGNRNAPTVYNAAAHFVQFWDGRAADVEAQAQGPVLNPIEMALPSAKDAEDVLQSMPEYVEAFRRAFPNEKQPATFQNMANAIGAFERRLMTPGRWDRFLAGDHAALTSAEKDGLNEFVAAGCQACHSGMLLGGHIYQKLGVASPYPDDSDQGRFGVTKNKADAMLFKVPSLRNVAVTAPYFHNGKIPTLEKAVEEMGSYQLGKQLKPVQIGAIVAFLKALTGEPPADLIKAPELPKSTAKSPKPQTGD